VILENIISISAIGLIIFGLVFFLFFNVVNKRKNLRELPRGIYFICLIAAGIMLNFMGYVFENGTETSWLFRMGASMGITMTMFGLEYDGGNSASLAGVNPLYGIAATLCYFAAILFTVLFVVQVFFKGLENSLRVFINAHWPLGGKTFIIVGTGESAELLLDSLDPKQKRRTTLILDEEDEELKGDYMGRGYAVINTAADGAALVKAGLLSAREPVLISLSPQDENNLAAARAIISLITPLNEKEKRELRFAAYIKYTSLDRTEHFQFTQAAEGRIQFFNPYEIIARRFLARNPISRLIPANFIDTAIARLKRPYVINHIFVGFGMTNTQMLKKSVVIDQLLGCDYNALVIDNAIDDNEEAFMNSARGLFPPEPDEDPQTELFFPLPEEKYLIEFFGMNVLSRSFYRRITAKIKAGDFTAAIIALGNDKLSGETAMEIRQWAYENNISPQKLRIFFRAKKHSAITAEDVINPNSVPGKEGDTIKIEAFGFEDEIFGLEHIINEDADRLAKHIAENYSGAAEFSSRWETLTNHERDSNRYAALSIKVKLNLMGFDLVFDETGTLPQDQEILKEFAGVYGMERARKLRDKKSYLEFVERKGGAPGDMAGTIVNTSIRNNLARLEHQRWNSYYLVNGWQPMPKAEVSAQNRKNQRTKKHACVTTFEGLDELARLQASLKIESLEANEKEKVFLKTMEAYDTTHLDFDQMDCLLGNLQDTKYRIIRLAESL
jgi:hypothetical protein